MKFLHKFIASVAGSGYSPIAPGTVGSIVAIILYILFFKECTLNCTLTFLAVVSIIGFWSTYEVEKIWPHDDSRVVMDEFIGIFVTLLFIEYSVLNAVLALVLFRIFDIWKPLGIRTVDEKLGGAQGVILDDVLAGIYANISLQLITLFIIPKLL